MRHALEMRLINQVLWETENQPRCQHLKTPDGDIQCGLLPDHELGLHELQLWCVDGERCKHCIFYKDMKISREELNKSTLDVADLLASKGIEGFQWSPCLDHLCAALSRTIENNGYRVPDGMTYTDWQELRKQRKISGGT